jgi:hypothetical protein
VVIEDLRRLPAGVRVLPRPGATEAEVWDSLRQHERDHRRAQDALAARNLLV